MGKRWKVKKLFLLSYLFFWILRASVSRSFFLVVFFSECRCHDSLLRETAESLKVLGGLFGMCPKCVRMCPNVFGNSNVSGFELNFKEKCVRKGENGCVRISMEFLEN